MRYPVQEFIFLQVIFDKGYNDYMKISTGRFSTFAALFFALVLPGVSFAQNAGIAEQRRINELAAALSGAQASIFAASPHRNEGEKLEQYATRISSMKLSESLPQRIGRLQSYLAALERATNEVKKWRRPAKRTDSSDGNRKLWTCVWKSVDALPARVAKTKLVLKRFKPGDEDFAHRLFMPAGVDEHAKF